MVRRIGAVGRSSAVKTAYCKLLLPTLLCLVSGEIDNQKMGLGQTQQGFDAGHVRRVNCSRVNKIPLLLGGFLSQDVGVEGVLPLQFSGTGQLETLFGTRVGFLFWHD